MPIPMLLMAALALAASPPLRLHPENPRYFEFRGKPAVLVTSGEHYGAVLNLDFDQVPYLDELQSRGFNLTRTFSGTYREVPGSFKIRDNTLAPAAGRYRAPWPEHDGKFDLTRIDPDYLARLKGFLAEASKRGTVVEIVLFCPFYEEELWAANPMNARNNVNGLGQCPREEVYTLKHPDLLKAQLAFVTRIVTELNAFDNLYYEICNEPYFGGVTLPWQRRVSEAIEAAERGLPQKHLIAQNIANGSERIADPDPRVSIFNFHYASPPDTVKVNRALNRPIAFDETGFKGTGDAVYRRQAWEFLLAGGAVFSHLDYSFTTRHPDGRARVTDPTPGGGGPDFRRQLAVLKKLIDGLDLPRLEPDATFLRASGDGKAEISALADHRRGDYLVYIAPGSAETLRLTLDLPRRTHRLEWIDPRTGDILEITEIAPVTSDDMGKPSTTITFSVSPPPHQEDIAARITSRPTRP